MESHRALSTSSSTEIGALKALALSPTGSASLFHFKDLKVASGQCEPYVLWKQIALLRILVAAMARGASARAKGRESLGEAPQSEAF